MFIKISFLKYNIQDCLHLKDLIEHGANINKECNGDGDFMQGEIPLFEVC